MPGEVSVSAVARLQLPIDHYSDGAALQRLRDEYRRKKATRRTPRPPPSLRALRTTPNLGSPRTIKRMSTAISSCSAPERYSVRGRQVRGGRTGGHRNAVTAVPRSARARMLNLTAPDWRHQYREEMCNMEDRPELDEPIGRLFKAMASTLLNSITKRGFLEFMRPFFRSTADQGADLRLKRLPTTSHRSLADRTAFKAAVVVDRLFSLFDASEYGATISRYDFVSTIELFLKGSLSAQLRCAFHVYRLSASRKDIRGKVVEVVTRGDLFRLMRLDACASPWMKGDVLNLLRVFHSRADACLEDGLRLGDSVEALVNAQTLYPRINHHNSLLLDYEGGSWQYDSTQKLIDDLIHRITEAEDSGSSSEQSVDSHSMRDYVTFDEFRASARSCSMTKLFVHLISSANLSKSRRRRREACK